MKVLNLTVATESTFSDGHVREWTDHVVIRFDGHEIYREPLEYSYGNDEDNCEDAIQHFAEKLKALLA